MDVESDILARGINTKFSIHYEATKQGIHHGVSFSNLEFVRPIHDTTCNARVILSNIIESKNKAPLNNVYNRCVGSSLSLLLIYHIMVVFVLILVSSISDD